MAAERLQQAGGSPRPPAVGALLRRPDVARLVAEHGHDRVVLALRAAVNELRASPDQRPTPAVADRVSERATALLARAPARLRRVINGTGIIIHTNLGRAPLSHAAAYHAVEIATGYSNLELDLSTGRRGDRHGLVSELLCSLSGAEAALVVNNGAAAVLLALIALCQRRDVVVSRGEAIEIGGGFRIPDILRLSGARLVEVGTTNRTRVGDYLSASGPRTAAWLRVHQSNFRMDGFTERATLSQLAEAAHELQLPLLEDVGSGLVPDKTNGVRAEDRLKDSIAGGVDLLFCSGDKLLGASQAGIILGREVLVDKLRRHPMARALRPDKLQLAALEETVLCLGTPDRLDEIPVWRMLRASEQELLARASRWVQALGNMGVPAQVIPLAGGVGGGTTPGDPLPSYGIILRVARPGVARRRLLAGDPPVLALERENGLAIDARCVLEADEPSLLRALASLSTK